MMEDESHPLLFDIRMRDLWYILSERSSGGAQTVLSICDTNIHLRMFLIDRICTCEHLYCTMAYGRHLLTHVTGGKHCGFDFC